MRRVIMMEADISDDSTPLLDTFDDIAEGQSKITIAQVKVCSASQWLLLVYIVLQRLLSSSLLVYIVQECFSAASCWYTLYCSYHLPFCNDDQESG